MLTIAVEDQGMIVDGGDCTLHTVIDTQAMVILQAHYAVASYRVVLGEAQHGTHSFVQQHPRLVEGTNKLIRLTVQVGKRGSKGNCFASVVLVLVPIGRLVALADELGKLSYLPGVAVDFFQGNIGLGH